MSEWLNFVKSYAATHNIPYKQALKDHIKQEMKFHKRLFNLK